MLENRETVRATTNHAKGPAIVLLLVMCLAGGCHDSVPSVRSIERRRDEQQRQSTEAQHAREAFTFLATYGELDPREAKRRIASLLNAWIDANPVPAGSKLPDALSTLPAEYRQYASLDSLSASRFDDADVEYLRLNYTLRKITQWIDPKANKDPLLGDWIASQQERLGVQGVADLEQAAMLFDWTVRNIQLDPLEPQGPGPEPPPLPLGMRFRGPGYRQTTFETLFRGAGDALQRARVFIQLCRQSSIDACMLSHAAKSAPTREWAVGVRVGKELFLFEPGLGIPVPGPDQVGIATLEQAQADASILRRLNVPGRFDYPVTGDDVQKVTALLDAVPESITPRMKHLESDLTGDLRQVLYYDVDASLSSFQSLAGIETAAIWPLTIEARVYDAEIEALAKSDQQIAVWEAYNWGMLNGTFPLAVARWRHLTGDFERQEQEPGARIMYMEMRHPEFDIDDLESNVDLQVAYGVRRELGQTQEQYEFQIAQVQRFMRLAKRAATYWISLIHYDEAEFENSVSWFQKRVLDDELDSPWKSGARYNLARALEKNSDTQRAIELYKTEGDPQEHGNRIRARLLARE